ncbi:hypothetical protein BC834DRAFT_867963 [Gloeopeniophorella convolvens]|nr:hypothetical protein BC834DRAFT_867963 [Gloeopeniophorella convolvens]
MQYPLASALPYPLGHWLVLSFFFAQLAVAVFMLGTHTKQVFSYGRRNRRIISVSKSEVFDDESTKRISVYNAAPNLMRDAQSNENTLSISGAPLSKRKQGAGKRLGVSSAASSTFSSPAPSHRVNKASKVHKTDSPRKPLQSSDSGRRPLGSHSINVLKQSTPVKPKRKARKSGSKGTPKSLAPQSPVIDVEIFVLDEAGTRVSQEWRTSRTNVQVNPATTVSLDAASSRRTVARADTIVISDDDDDDYVLSPQPKRRVKGRQLIVISSDEEDNGDPPVISIPSSNFAVPSSPPIPDARRDYAEVQFDMDHSEPTTPRHCAAAWPPSRSKTQFWAESPQPPFTAPSHHQDIPEPPLTNSSPPPPTRSKPRQLTPIRRKVFTSRNYLPPSPSSSIDLDVSDASLDIEELTLSSVPFKGDATPTQPAYLTPLLEECGQSAPVEFSAFIDSFPFHPIVRSSDSRHAAFQKIGEASYSEVFGIGDVVLKIIPLRKEEAEHESYAESPAPSDAKDVLKEIIVTRAMGEICDGFVSLLKTYVVRGKYPSLLLDLWDEYNQTKGSESVRPDMLAVSQVYAIIVLPNGGPDLEAYTFAQPTKTGWRQACSLFWQITRTLATAEDLVSFEHRDLHWGQILVKNIPAKLASRRGTLATDVWLPMDHESHGVRATVIDLGLARVDSFPADGDIETHWTPFDEDIFDGEGDYQFDIYRLMRDHIGGRWDDFRPLTNVMWLHYLTLKLLKSKQLRAPRKSAVTGNLVFTERQCYECLLELEALLSQTLRTVTRTTVAKKGRKKASAPAKEAVAPASDLQCAGDILKFGQTMGWV